MSPVVALIMIGLTAGVWHLTLRRYSSAVGWSSPNTYVAPGDITLK
jgi:hypothetical protein